MIDNSESAAELLVGFWKKGTSRPSISWAESVEVALCFGWIDGIRRRIDDESYSIRFTPRRPNSIWSDVNIAKFKRLHSEGRVTSAGQNAFDLRRDEKSRVYSYERKKTVELNHSEQGQFKNNKLAWSYFEGCPPGYRKKMLHWVTAAKKADTRARRLNKLILACAREQRLA